MTTSSSMAAGSVTGAWLPANTRPPAALDARLAGVIEEWSARWFAGVPMALAPLDRADRADLSWRAPAGGPALGLATDAALIVGARMLAVARDGRAPHERALLEDVAEDCLADLRARIAEITGAPRDAEWRPVVRAAGWLATVDGPRGPIAIALSGAAFASSLKAALGSGGVPPLGTGAAALATIDVAVSASVGRAALTVADLRALEAGDVVVLDSRLADPVPLAVDGGALARGTVRVVAANSAPCLEVVHAAA